MKETPILMTPENGQMCFEGTKTQTRRIIQPQPLSISWSERQNGWCARVRDDTGSAENPAYVMVPCPYGGVGDRLWVQEDFAYPAKGKLFYRGDRQDRLIVWHWQNYQNYQHVEWERSGHMKRALCRTVVEITSIRAERVQDISEEDAKAEGWTECSTPLDESDGRKRPNLTCLYCGQNKIFHVGTVRGCPGGTGTVFSRMSFRGSFSYHWESINGPGSWARNDYVWVIGFRKIAP